MKALLMKSSRGTICDYIVTTCPYCGKSVEEYWGDLTDITMDDFESGETLECPHCGKEFIVNIEE
jgi:transcription elongation factor Elf1